MEKLRKFLEWFQIVVRWLYAILGHKPHKEVSKPCSDKNSYPENSENE